MFCSYEYENESKTRFTVTNRHAWMHTHLNNTGSHRSRISGKSNKAHCLSKDMVSQSLFSLFSKTLIVSRYFLCLRNYIKHEENSFEKDLTFENFKMNCNVWAEQTMMPKTSVQYSSNHLIKNIISPLLHKYTDASLSDFFTCNKLATLCLVSLYFFLHLYFLLTLFLYFFFLSNRTLAQSGFALKKMYIVR